jgi:ethanolamine utilization protein EutP (predicted NTPase)
MAQQYIATAKRNPGRQAWLVEFRHPLKLDAANKPGRKTRKGLGTTDEKRATLLVEQLNGLLANRSLWAVGAKQEAQRLFEPEVVEIFYGEIEPRDADAKHLRDRLAPFPPRTDGFAKVALVGVPGAGKTTLLRQLLGTHPKQEAFPSTSLNRTTTFPAEFVLRPGPFHAVVTFMSEHETRFEVEECVSAAVIEAVEGDTESIARTFLEKSDMRFRLKYVLGDLVHADDDVDPYADDEEDTDNGADELALTSQEQTVNADLVRSYVERIQAIAASAKRHIEGAHGPLADMTLRDHAAALELVEEHADASDEFLELVSDVVQELGSRFDAVGAGKYDRTTTGWPRSWELNLPDERRGEFIRALRFFSGVSDRSWGKLVTPLVNGMRVEGPFKPKWTPEQPRLVLMDTEGLGHKANATADIPEQTSALLHEVDVILLVESAKSGLTNFAAGKALEAVANTGLTRKLAMVFTHMDMATAAGLKGQRLHDHVLAGVRNVVDNQLARALTPESARFLLQRVLSNAFFVGRLDKADAKGAEGELNRLLSHLMAEQPPVVRPIALPEYNFAFLLMALQEAARDFRQQWQGLLSTKPWQTIKALSRRYAEGWGEDFELRPSANLRARLETAVARFLEGPVAWSGNPTPEEKRFAIEWLKTGVTRQLAALARRRLREKPQTEWYDAWAPRGAGSTTTRRIRIEGIYQRWVPIPESRGDQAVIDFMQEVQQVVNTALDEFRQVTTSAAPEGL